MAAVPKPPHPDCVPLFAEARGDIAVSFEFFPPRTDKMGETLWESIKTLEPLAPRFVSVTYGAGGSTRERTHATVARLARSTGLVPAAHLTCVAATRDEVDRVARDYKAAGVDRVVALRGDPPAGVGARYEPHPGGYANAAHLVEVSSASPTSRSRSRAIRRSIQTARRWRPQGRTRSRAPARWKPGRKQPFPGAAARPSFRSEKIRLTAN